MHQPTKKLKKRNQQSVSLLAFAVVATFAANANAAGLTPGQCYAKADAMAVMKQEGQVTLMMGNRITDDSNANILSVNRQGYGYNIEGDAPLGQKSTKLCVAAVFKNTILNNINNPEIPSFAKDIKSTGNGIDVAKAYQNGSRIILRAQTYTPMADGAEVLGKSIVVSATPSDKGADVWAVDGTGAPGGLFSMTNFGTTKEMADLVNGKLGSETK